MPVFLLASLPLGAQGVFTNANKPGDPTCPRLLQDKTELEYKSQYGANQANFGDSLYHQQGDVAYPIGQRKDVTAFAAIDEHGRKTTLASLKGKIVLVGLWSTHCDPSAKMLMEFSRIYGKRNQYGFDILAVNFDETKQEGNGIEGGWRAIDHFKIRNRDFFSESHLPLYIPGVGKEGPSNFMDMVYSLPVLFVVDQDGKLAQVHVGYHNGFVGQALKRALIERQQLATRPPQIQPAGPTQPPAPQIPVPPTQSVSH